MPSESHSGNVAYVRNPAVLAANLGGNQLALLSASRDNYHGLEGPAVRIWELLEAPHTIDQLCVALLEEFEVEPDECERDTREFVASMLAEALITEQSA